MYNGNSLDNSVNAKDWDAKSKKVKAAVQETDAEVIDPQLAYNIAASVSFKVSTFNSKWRNNFKAYSGNIWELEGYSHNLNVPLARRQSTNYIQQAVDLLSGTLENVDMHIDLIPTSITENTDTGEFTAAAQTPQSKSEILNANVPALTEYISTVINSNWSKDQFSSILNRERKLYGTMLVGINYRGKIDYLQDQTLQDTDISFSLIQPQTVFTDIEAKGHNDAQFIMVCNRVSINYIKDKLRDDPDACHDTIQLIQDGLLSGVGLNAVTMQAIYSNWYYFTPFNESDIARKQVDYSVIMTKENGKVRVMYLIGKFVIKNTLTDLKHYPIVPFYDIRNPWGFFGDSTTEKAIPIQYKEAVLSTLKFNWELMTQNPLTLIDANSGIDIRTFAKTKTVPGAIYPVASTDLSKVIYSPPVEQISPSIMEELNSIPDKIYVQYKLSPTMFGQTPGKSINSSSAINNLIEQGFAPLNNDLAALEAGIEKIIFVIIDMLGSQAKALGWDQVTLRSKNTDPNTGAIANYTTIPTEILTEFTYATMLDIELTMGKKRKIDKMVELLQTAQQFFPNETPIFNKQELVEASEIPNKATILQRMVMESEEITAQEAQLLMEIVLTTVEMEQAQQQGVQVNSNPQNAVMTIQGVLQGKITIEQLQQIAQSLQQQLQQVQQEEQQMQQAQQAQAQQNQQQPGQSSGAQAQQPNAQAAQNGQAQQMSNPNGQTGGQ